MANEQFKLVATPDANDGAGKSSCFALTDAKLASHLDDHVCTPKLSVSISGKAYRGEIHHDHVGTIMLTSPVLGASSSRGFAFLPIASAYSPKSFSALFSSAFQNFSVFRTKRVETQRSGGAEKRSSEEIREMLKVSGTCPSSGAKCSAAFCLRNAEASPMVHFENRG